MSISAARGQWLSAEDISSLFAVAPGTLELYSLRGTLPSYVDGQGVRLFDVETAASIFRRRGAPPAEAPRGHFGRLGAVVLGAAPLETVPLASSVSTSRHSRA